MVSQASKARNSFFKITGFYGLDINVKENDRKIRGKVQPVTDNNWRCKKHLFGQYMVLLIFLRQQEQMGTTVD